MHGKQIWLLMALCTCSPLLAAGGTGGAVPRIHVETTVWDFGEVTEGVVARGEIAVENRGNAPLKIVNIRSGCSACTAAAVMDEPVPPGGLMKIRLQFNSAGTSGSQSKVVYVHCNDPDTPFVQVKVTGTVKRDPDRPIAVLSAEAWDAGLIYAGQSAEGQLKIRNEGKRELQILGVHALAPLAVSCEKAKLGPGEEAVVKVRVEPKDFRGILSERIVVNTSDPVLPSQTVQVTGYAAKDAGPTGKLNGAVIILPRESVKLPGTQRVFYMEYEITNNTTLPIVLRCLSPEGCSRLDADEIIIAPASSRVTRITAGGKGPAKDKMLLGIQLDTYSSTDGK